MVNSSKFHQNPKSFGNFDVVFNIAELKNSSRIFGDKRLKEIEEEEKFNDEEEKLHKRQEALLQKRKQIEKIRQNLEERLKALRQEEIKAIAEQICANLDPEVAAYLLQHPELLRK